MANKHKKHSNDNHSTETKQRTSEPGETSSLSKPENNKRKEAVNRDSRGSSIFTVFRKLFRWSLFIGLVVISAATVTILLGCSDGGKQLNSGKETCADLVRLSKFTKPSAKFTTNLMATYSDILLGYRSKLQQIYANFARSEWGSIVHKWFIVIHSKIVEWSLLVWRHLINIYETIANWYTREGEKTFGSFVNGCKLFFQMVWEMAKDLTGMLIEFLSTAYLRCKTFWITIQTEGFSKAFDELIHRV